MLYVVLKSLREFVPNPLCLTSSLLHWFNSSWLLLCKVPTASLHLTVRAEWRGWLGTNHSEHSGPSSRCKVAAPGHRPGQWIMSTVLLNNDEFLVRASIYSTRHVKLSQMLTSAGSCLTCPRGLLRYSKLSQEMHWDQKLFSQNRVWLALARPAGGGPCSSLGVIMVRRRWQPRKPVIISLPG